MMRKDALQAFPKGDSPLQEDSALLGPAPGVVVAVNSEAEYHTALEAAGERLVLVDCYADWCGPCRAIAPAFKAFADEYRDVVFLKVDVDKAPGVSKQLKVMAMPTFVFVRSGKRVGSVTGASAARIKVGLDNDGSVSLCGQFCAVQ